MSDFQRNLEKLRTSETQVLGISGDEVNTQRSFAGSLNLGFPLLSDRGYQMARKYGIMGRKDQRPARTTIVIDKQGIVRYVEQGMSAVSSRGAIQACVVPEKKQ